MAKIHEALAFHRYLVVYRDPETGKLTIEDSSDQLDKARSILYSLDEDKRKYAAVYWREDVTW